MRGFSEKFCIIKLFVFSHRVLFRFSSVKGVISLCYRCALPLLIRSCMKRYHAVLETGKIRKTRETKGTRETREDVSTQGDIKIYI